MKGMVRGNDAAPPSERGPAYLTVVIDGKEVQRRPIAPAAAVTMGRSLDCDIWLDDPRLSRSHCRIEPALEGDGWAIEDLNSRNGTFLNNKRIIQRVPLHHRDVISIGRATIKFHAHGYLPPRPTDPTEATMLPAKTRAALEARQPTPHYSQRPLPKPVPRDIGGDSTISQSPGETISDKSLPFTRPPARPIVKPLDEDE